MDEIQAKLKCQNCDTIGSIENPTYMMIECDHFFCAPCINEFSVGADVHEDYQPICSICSSISKCVQLPVFIFDVPVTDPQSSSNSIPENHIKCAQCGSKDSEKKMYICETCHGLKFENQEDVKKHAHCSDCTIKKHMRQGHQTVDFFPYLSAHHFSTQSKLITPKFQNLENARKLLNDTVSTFNDVSAAVTENYNVLTNMAQRSKCTKSQVELFEKMGNFLDESTLVKVKANSELEENVNALKEKLKNIEKWYLCRMDDCMDESELVKIGENEENSPETALLWRTLKLREDAQNLVKNSDSSDA